MNGRILEKPLSKSIIFQEEIMQVKTTWQSLSEMPIWARLAFAVMVPRTYFRGKYEIPRKASEAVVTGFYRNGNVIWISYYFPDWEGGYLWPAIKNWNQDWYNKDVYHCLLDPSVDPTAFLDDKTGIWFHRCDYAGRSHFTHDHHVSYPHHNCYDPGAVLRRTFSIEEQGADGR
jgi:hypothetical protein